MNITTKIIITDTNTDLNTAKILDKFVSLDNVYVSDLVKIDEVNKMTGNIKIINKFKIITSTAEELSLINELSRCENKLSIIDLLNYVIAKNHNGILATGDNRLKTYAESNGVEVIRTLKIIKLLKEHNIITKDELITACNLLLNYEKTRIPEKDIKNLLEEYEKEEIAI